jgi:hypothetical protein
MLILRLKYMQAVALVTGDEFLVQYNLTIDAEDVLDYIKNQLYDWTEFGCRSEAEFDDRFKAHLALIPGPSGYCYNFNLADGSDLFHLEKYT